MTGPTAVGFLDFFILEAGDYVEQLDAQLLSGGATGPDADALQRVARALRGSATMAKIPAFAEMAAGMERVGRALREGALSWDTGLRGAMVAAVDDCKLLLRNVRGWSAEDDRRARARLEELVRYAPPRAAATPLSAGSIGGHVTYLATEAANIGAGLELLATRPSDRDAAGNVLRRVRALRGIASVKDHASLADVLEAAERAARPLELGEPALSPARVGVLAAAATVLRDVAAAIRSGTPASASSPALVTFAAALQAMQEGNADADRVIPIATMFYDDGGQTVLETAANPPTTPAERFRLEVVSQGEHLRRLVSDAREAHDDLARERVRRELRQALLALRLSAESFGEEDVATFVASHNDSAVQLDARALASLADAAALLAQPGKAGERFNQRLAALHASRAMPTPIVAMPVVAPPTEVPQERDRTAATAMGIVAVRAVTSPAAARSELLERGISNLGALALQPLSTPVDIGDQPDVAIEVLLYRGQAAIQRCREIRDEVRSTDGPVDADTLGELFDLLDLALTD